MNLVFASGFLFPQRLFGIDYFKGLKEHLRDGPHVALFPPVVPLASSQARADSQTKSAMVFRKGRSTSSRIRWADWTAGI
jgi:hypothetical protein